jgi:hypothetical protein
MAQKQKEEKTLAGNSWQGLADTTIILNFHAVKNEATWNQSMH